ncbi:helix-turn-helix domain-containing protein [Streptomyces sp. NPDC002265]|uniref:helix-turn-helix domain-containing protein n=1 Tax=Streptomyces sp. NPDC002265 TaxID=3154415 RepID=UPI0033186E40
MRARMIELSWSGLRVPAIVVELGCSQKTVRCWLHRFNRLGLQGLDDLGGQGRKRRITEHERSRIISLVKTGPPGRPVHRIVAMSGDRQRRGPGEGRGRRRPGRRGGGRRDFRGRGG